MLALAISAIVPVAALGSTTSKTVAPTHAERTAMLKAFGDPSAAASCLTTRLAGSNHNYGSVFFVISKRCQRWAFNGRNVLKRGKQGNWHVVFEGSSYTCPRAKLPRQVQRDLSICP
jgi:hypothetical protein